MVRLEEKKIRILFMVFPVWVCNVPTIEFTVIRLLGWGWSSAYRVPNSRTFEETYSIPF